MTSNESNASEYILVREGKFEEVPHETAAFLRPDDLQSIAALGGLFVDLHADDKAESLASYLGSISRIRIAFDATADGRGFGIAKKLRRLGYQGVIAARGELIPDQYPMALQCGIDELEIPRDRAERQPETQWAAGLRRTRYYQQRLGFAGRQRLDVAV